ncbi:hypothetical protein V5O48_012747 [Marasmius crinis-equi]|uniref:F-box domain-containing protein n=1 Tax=Marasmius crinis-equi TaxID=585013 RepID=A0ABR3F2B5_9AGAR
MSSPFSHLLNSDYAPSLDERVAIKSWLLSPEEQLRSLDEEISRLQAERDKLRSLVEQHQMLLSPFRRFPIEIWQEIFVHCLPSIPARTLKNAPLLLTGICRSWREIALGTPRLWNNIHIHFPSRNPKSPDPEGFRSLIRGRIDGVKSWLNRSGSLPLTVSLSVGAPHVRLMRRNFDIDKVAVGELLEGLALYSPRWKVIKILHSRRPGLTDVVWSSLGQLTQEDLPMLEEYNVPNSLFKRTEPPVPTLVPTRLANLITRLPTIRVLHISRSDLDAVVNLASPSWTSLTTLHLTEFNVQSHFEAAHLASKIAQLYPFLISFSFHPLLYRAPNVDPFQNTRDVEAIPFPRLRTLVITGKSITLAPGETIARNVSRLLYTALRHIHAPSLQSLDVFAASQTHGASQEDSDSGNLYDGFYFPFDRMISQSQCFGLEHLSIGGFPTGGPGTQLERSLEMLHELRSLTFIQASGSDFQRPILHLLQSSPKVCPKLEKLEMKRQGGELTSTIQLFDVILDLAVLRTMIRVVSVDFGEISKTEVEGLVADRHARVQELREGRGLRVDWKWQEMEEPAALLRDDPYA